MALYRHATRAIHAALAEVVGFRGPPGAGVSDGLFLHYMWPTWPQPLADGGVAVPGLPSPELLFAVDVRGCWSSLANTGSQERRVPPRAQPAGLIVMVWWGPRTSASIACTHVLSCMPTLWAPQGDVFFFSSSFFFFYFFYYWALLPYSPEGTCCCCTARPWTPSLGVRRGVLTALGIPPHPSPF